MYLFFDLWIDDCCVVYVVEGIEDFFVGDGEECVFVCLYMLRFVVVELEFVLFVLLIEIVYVVLGVFGVVYFGVFSVGGVGVVFFGYYWFVYCDFIDFFGGDFEFFVLGC